MDQVVYLFVLMSNFNWMEYYSHLSCGLSWYFAYWVQNLKYVGLGIIQKLIPGINLRCVLQKDYFSDIILSLHLAVLQLVAWTCDPECLWLSTDVEWCAIAWDGLDVECLVVNWGIDVGFVCDFNFFFGVGLDPAFVPWQEETIVYLIIIWIDIVCALNLG